MSPEQMSACAVCPARPCTGTLATPGSCRGTCRTSNCCQRSRLQQVRWILLEQIVFVELTLFIMFIIFVSVFRCKVGNQNQVFHKYKSRQPGCESPDHKLMEKQNSIERLNCSLSSGRSQSQKQDNKKSILLRLF